MCKNCVPLFVAAAMLLGAATVFVSSPGAEKPIHAPVSLTWAPDQPGDGCPYSKPIFLVTNHTGKTVKVSIRAIETHPRSAEYRRARQKPISYQYQLLNKGKHET
jgi:hypothetical protein